MINRRLYDAALRGDAATVLAALETGANPNLCHWAPADMPLFKGQVVRATPLVAACWTGSVSCAEILAPVSSLSWADEGGVTALMRACQRGNFACADKLASVETCAHRDSVGWTALFYACLSSHESRQVALGAGHRLCISSVIPFSNTRARSNDRVNVREILFHYGTEGLELRSMIDSLLEAEDIAVAAPAATAPTLRSPRL